ncbi:MAG TPA: GNAT family N-acetyltransferase [Mucilaginibacter sp.]|jgi:GNAT superfamily N-acetyltransferase
MSTDIKAVKYKFERLSEYNITDLEKLHTAVYAQTLPQNYFQNKYDTAFTSVQHTGYIAYDSGRAIAFYGVIPCFIRLNGSIILAAQSADTMTHPQYRNKGLFIELAKETFELCGKNGIELLFGFPNQNSLYGFVNRLGWTTTERMSCFIISAGTFSWQRIFRKLPLLQTWYKSYQQRQLKKVSLPQKGIDNSVFNDNYGGLLRGQNYFEYKKYSTTHVIKLGHSILWIKINNELVIGDISVSPGDFDDMIKKLKRFAYKLGIKEIHFHACPNTTLHSLFVGRFNALPSFPVIFKELNGTADIGHIKFTSADIDTF